MVTHTKINGTDYPMLFGWNAVRWFSEETKVNIAALDYMIATRVDLLFLAIYIAICEGYKVEGKALDNFTIELLGREFDKDPGAVQDCLEKLSSQLKMITEHSKKKKKQKQEPKK